MKSQKSGIKLPAYKKKMHFIAALVSGAAILFSGCENDLEKIKAFSSPQDLPVLYAENYKSTYIDSGQVRNYLEAPVLQQFESDGRPFIEFPKGVILNKFDNQNKIISKITADYAKQYTKENKWEAKYNVIAINSDGDTLKTEHLIWEEKAGKIYSDKLVKFVRQDKIIYGEGFESDQDMGNWRISQVNGTLCIDMDKNQERETEVEAISEPAPKNNKIKQLEKNPVQKPINIQE